MSVNKSNLRMTKLAAGLSLAVSLIGVQAHVFAKGVKLSNTAKITAVTSCADDKSSGTLRQVIAGATNGAELDLSGLSCANNTITLTQGEIVISQNVTLTGAFGSGLTISSGAGRVLNSTADSLSIVNLTVSGGGISSKSDDAEGGCILAAGHISLTNSAVTDCSVYSARGVARGGAISALSVSLVNSKVTGSSAIASGYFQVARGGGVYAGTLSCVDSTLSGNIVAADSGNGYGQGGGAFIPGGNLSLSRCTIDSNVAGEGGGIMQIVFPESARVVTNILNSTISGNTATFAAAGVSVFCSDCTPQPVRILNSTVAFNASPVSYGDGITTNGVVDAQSSIIARNGVENSGQPADVSAAGLTGADNLVMATKVISKSGVVTVTDDPMLMPLADNGGPTRTHNMDAASPVMKLGNDSALFTTDQRGNGYSRSDDGMVDIGAFQHCQPASVGIKPLPPTTTKY